MTISGIVVDSNECSLFLFLEGVLVNDRNTFHSSVSEERNG